MDDISTGLVHYRFTLREGDAGIQLDTYTQCLKDHGHKHEWMGFLDADEVRATHMHSHHAFFRQADKHTSTSQHRPSDVIKLKTDLFMQFFMVHDKAFKHNIHSFLTQYHAFGGLAINWRVRGT